MERLLSTLNSVMAATLILAVFTPAYAVDNVFGRTSLGTLPSAGLSADFKRGSRYALNEPAAVHTICAFIDGNGGASGNQSIRYAIYSDVGGTPSARLAASAEMVIPSGTASQFRCMQVANTILAPGQYWIVLQTSGVAGVIRDYGDGQGNWYGNADAYADSVTDPFGPGSTGNPTLSAFAIYSPPVEATNAGRTTLGTKNSAGMSADFKRASSFTIQVPGRLGSMTAYLDGRGGTVGNQELRYVLYQDANGVPGAMVAQSQSFTLGSDTAPGWYPAGIVESASLASGKYWFAIHTGGTAGVLRNYADGAGNWYGNADTFAGGPSAPFGAGNTGNGTLSAYITYDSRVIRTVKVGRSDVATVPSAGLRANLMRGSQFIYNNQGAELRELSAYLDGLGGAAGSQKIRMALYQLAQGENAHPLWLRRAESNEVSIAAGTPPGWVHFPVAPTDISQGVTIFYFAIESGDTGGVVRDYGDGQGNWISKPITYPQGAPPFFYEDSTVAHGMVTLSVYGTVLDPTTSQ